MKLLVLAIAVFIACISKACATMPELTAQPPMVTVGLCRQWALHQSDDVLEMWSTQENGSQSHELALDRLTLDCLGQKPPDVVYFWSSAGFRDQYCKKHPGIKICDEAEDDTQSGNKSVQREILSAQKTNGSAGGAIIITSKSDSITIKDVKLNRGNCRPTVYQAPHLRFGQAFTVLAIGCNPIEMEVITDQGSQTFTWPN